MTRELSDLIIAIVGAALLFVAMPWLFLHYATRWHRQEEINQANQALIAELTERAGRLEERAATLERIAEADGTAPPLERGAESVDPGHDVVSAGSPAA
jgi:phage shock protein B